MGWLTENFERDQLDAHGQPAFQGYRSAAVGDRQVDELIGLVKGVLADGAICQGEVEFLLRWMEANQAAANAWPASVLYPRIAAALADGHMDAEEEREIMGLLVSTSGGAVMPTADAPSQASSLPFCDPLPIIDFAGRSFCFTGKFVSGSRNWCGQQVQQHGGVLADGITKKLHFLVIGEIGSRDWLHSTYGLKIKKAMDYRTSGLPIHIVGEKHWHGQLHAQGTA